ncbi:DNA polymerase [Mesorhizobium sp. M0139]|uniref:DNA polymerase n=1 Tax=Mesorhizobium sp. M0139 TaxID=2956892 RepID=UPI00333C8C49
MDFETRSAADLKRCGVYAYAAHATTDIWCLAYAFDDGPIEVWTPGQPVPADIVEHIMLDGVLTAHNAAFERIIWRYILAPRYGFPEPATEQWRCTMAMAYSLALPGSLENAAPAAGLDMAKDKHGHRLMMQMARPRKTEPELIWWNEPEKIVRLIEYCKQDVAVERALEKRLRPLSVSELALWHLDQKINDRGVLVDETLALAAKGIVKQAQADLDVRMRALTDNEVSACSNRNQLVKWIRAQGVDCDSINKAAMEVLLEEDNPLPPQVRAVLLVRQESARASVAKIDSLLNGKSPEDDRAKGLLQFHSASTGRWGGRRFQPQNLKRPDEEDIDTLIDIVATGDFDYLSMSYPNPLSAVGDILRGLVVAAPGHRIVAADYSNIEGRVLAWLAGEQWKLDAFRAFDGGTGHDLYKITAAGILGKEPSAVTKDERQSHGKVPELALGYQGGVGAFSTMAANYGLTLEVPVIEAIRDGWREKHPRIKQFWYGMEEAAVDAVQRRGEVTRVGKIAFKVAGSWLMMRLPSGRYIAYPRPEIREFDVPWGGTKAGLTYFSTIDPAKKGKIIDDDANSTTWARIKTYGGMLAENATQAVARDVLADAMPRLEAAGYPIILTVHDEVVCEVPTGHGSVDEMEEIMCDLPAWAAGLPVAAEGFEGERYRK